MGWRTHTELGPDRTVHTWPEDDVQEHLTEPDCKTFCWCDPEVLVFDNGNLQVVHRDALDRLELA